MGGSSQDRRTQVAKIKDRRKQAPQVKTQANQAITRTTKIATGLAQSKAVHPQPNGGAAYPRAAQFAQMRTAKRSPTRVKFTSMKKQGNGRAKCNATASHTLQQSDAKA